MFSEASVDHIKKRVPKCNVKMVYIRKGLKAAQDLKIKLSPRRRCNFAFGDEACFPPDFGASGTFKKASK